MSDAGFAAVCKRKRDWRKYCLRGPSSVGEVKNIAPEWRRCTWCKGERENWPEELAVIKLEEHMAKKDGGRCVICDAKTELKNARGCMMVCPTCHKIVGYVDNHLGRIAEAAKGLGKEAELASALGAAVDPADHAIAEAVRECFGRDLTVEQLGQRCLEEAEKAARIEGELAQMRGYADEAMRTLAAVLPHEDEGLDDTRSYADIVDLAERAAERIGAEPMELSRLRSEIKTALEALMDRVPQPQDEPPLGIVEAARRLAERDRVNSDLLAGSRTAWQKAEALAGAAENNAKAAKAWNALMDRARDVGFAEIADGDPVVMAGTYIMAVNEVMAERDRLKDDLAAIRRILEPVLADANISFDDLPEACRIMADNVKNARNIIADHNKARSTIAEQEKIIAELAGELDRANVALPASNPVDDALLKWARERLEHGELSLRVEEAAA